MRKILLIDDEESLTLSLGETLRLQLGVQVDVAHSGHEAIGILFHHRYDVVIVDYHMPNGNGADVLRFLYKHNWPTYSMLFTSELAPELPPPNEYFLGIVEKPDWQALLKRVAHGLALRAEAPRVNTAPALSDDENGGIF